MAIGGRLKSKAILSIRHGFGRLWNCVWNCENVTPPQLLVWTKNPWQIPYHFKHLIYKAISLHSGVITIHSGVRHLQLVLSVTLSWTLGKQLWHRFCMLQHNVQQTPAVKFMFLSCFWCCEHAPRCAPFGSEHHTTILAIQVHTFTDKWYGNVWARKEYASKRLCLSTFLLTTYLI